MNTEEKLLWRRDMHRYSQKMTEIQRKILQKRPPEERKKKRNVPNVPKMVAHTTQQTQKAERIEFSGWMKIELT